MSRVQVDSNILLDIYTEDKKLFSCSSQQLEKYANLRIFLS